MPARLAQHVARLARRCALAASVAACGSAPPPPPAPPAAPPPARPIATVIPRWGGVNDIPCSAGPQALLPALEARVLHRIRPPVGLIPVSVAGTTIARGLRVKVVMEIDRKGLIRRAVVAPSTGLSERDRAVEAAIDEAGCMPAPPRVLLDERSGTFRVSLGYLFRRG